MLKCFVIMPFSGKVNSYYKNLYKKVIEESGMEAVRVDELYGPKPIITDITEGISKADIVLADLSNKNPNVNYELGIAHTLGKPTILIAKSKEDISFDYQHIRIYFYDTSDINWQNDLKDYISKSISVINKNPENFALFDNILVASMSEYKRNNQSTLDYLFTQYKKQKATINYRSDFHIDKSGSALIETIFKVNTETDFSLLRYKIFNMLPGDVTIKSIKEIETNKSVNYCVYEKGKDFKGIYMFINTKPKGYDFSIKLTVFAENYIGDLISDNYSISHHTNNYNSEIQHNDETARYYFPTIELFENIEANATISYSNGSTEKKCLLRKKVKNNYLFEFENLDKVIPEFKIEFKM